MVIECPSAPRGQVRRGHTVHAASRAAQSARRGARRHGLFSVHAQINAHGRRDLNLLPLPLPWGGGRDGGAVGVRRAEVHAEDIAVATQVEHQVLCVSRCHQRAGRHVRHDIVLCTTLDGGGRADPVHAARARQLLDRLHLLRCERELGYTDGRAVSLRARNRLVHHLVALRERTARAADVMLEAEGDFLALERARLDAGLLRLEEILSCDARRQADARHHTVSQHQHSRQLERPPGSPGHEPR